MCINAISSSFIFTDFFGVNDVKNLVKNTHQQGILLATFHVSCGSNEYRCFGILHFTLEDVFRLSFQVIHRYMDKFTFHGFSRKRSEVLLDNRFHLCLIDITDKRENKTAGITEQLFVHFHDAFVIYPCQVLHFGAFCQRIVAIKSFRRCITEGHHRFGFLIFQLCFHALNKRLEGIVVASGSCEIEIYQLKHGLKILYGRRTVEILCGKRNTWPGRCRFSGKRFCQMSGTEITYPPQRDDVVHHSCVDRILYGIL
ncbi:hypothetical protein SDC9_131292 [bioreactor metagenome]|uniref:Uncharacterized protein n=1 Tax=bioreactor metagenome TaxID=1076179 RepID=A0A645D4T2_9ZZZZ